VAPKLTGWLLSILILATWIFSWWRGTRRFRLWFALLAPAACVLGVVVSLIAAGAQADGGCSSSCSGSAVQRWAASFDAPTPGIVWLETSALRALVVAVALSVLTLVVEYILLVLRDSRAARSQGHRRTPPH
jgi:hypothetical protein